MTKNKKYLIIPLFSIILVTLIFIFFNYNSNKRTTINIGVPILGETFHRYDILKEDLENKFNIKVNFVDVYSNIDFNNNPTQYDVIKSINNLLDNNDIDMIIGIPDTQLEYAINNNKLLDITDYISNINNLHRGVVNLSKKMGNGSIYSISPIFTHTKLVFQNELIFNELDVELLPQYVSWYEFLEKLDELQNEISYRQLEYYPLAFGVKNFNEDILFSSNEFIKHAFGLDSPMFEGDKFSDRWSEFYKIFSQIIARYGKDLAELGDGTFYPKDWAFVTGRYALMFADTYDIALFFSDTFNTIFNETSPSKIVADFPIKPTFVNYDGSRTHNTMTFHVAINRNTEEKELAIDILNYFLSKEYAFKIIESYLEYSHFSYYFFNFPSFYDEDVINELNEYFNGDFDISLLYDADYIAVGYDEARFYNRDLFDVVLNNAFTQIYNNRFNENLDYIIEETLRDVETKLNLPISSKKPMADGIDTGFSN